MLRGGPMALYQGFGVSVQARSLPPPVLPTPKTPLIRNVAACIHISRSRWFAGLH